MLSDALGESVLLLPASDLHTVTLRVLPGSDPANLTTDAIVSMCSAREITTRAIDRDAIEALIQRANEQHSAAHGEHGEGDSEEHPLEAIIASGTPPTHGTNGRFELDPHLAQQLERIKAAKASDATARSDDAVNPDSSDTNDAAVDHYNTSAFVIVDRETVIGCLTPPTEGEDGTDIHGDIIPAQPGRRATLDEHPSITVRRDGTIIANKHGRLVVRPGIVRVDHELVIRGNVDFSTGNIRFPGDVTITEGVKDRFRIESERSVRVLRLVEAASIHADLDAVLETGAAGRERGEIHAARDIHAGYLDAVAIHAGRDCTVEREITNCTADVGRHLVVSNGILRAGVYRCGFGCDAAIIGAQGGAETVIELGRPEALCAMVRKLDDAAPDIETLAADAEEELKNFPRGTKLTAQQAEALCELEFRASNARALLRPVAEARERLDVLRRSLPLPWLICKKVIEAGTIIRFGPYRLKARDAVKGPLRLDLPPSGPPTAREIATATVRPIESFFELALDPDAVDLRLADRLSESAGELHQDIKAA